MASVNMAVILGNCGRDPELKRTQSGMAICNLSLATSRKYKDAQGNLQDETEWHRVVLYDRKAETAAQYLKKGDAAYIMGRIRTREYTDNQGAKRYATEIVAEQLQLMPRQRTETCTYAQDNPAPATARSMPAQQHGYDDAPF